MTKIVRVWELGGYLYDRAMTFANGMALSPDKDHLSVAESFAGRVIRIPIDENGNPEEGELFVEGLERVPDGLAFDNNADRSPLRRPRTAVKAKGDAP